MEEGFGYFHMGARSHSPSSASGLPTPSALSISFILLNGEGLGDAFDTNWNTKPLILPLLHFIYLLVEGKTLKALNLLLLSNLKS